MSSGNIFERLFRQTATILKLVVDGRRDPERVAEFLQKVIGGDCFLDTLEFLGTVVIPATTTPFIAKEKFVVGTNRKAEIRISYPNNNFSGWFLSGDGKLEEPIPGNTLRYHRPRSPLKGDTIITELGGEEMAETTLTELYSLLEKQGDREDGALLTDGWWNIFFIRDQKGTLRTVSAHWYGAHWLVHASSVEDPCRWYVGNRVFSRNS